MPDGTKMTGATHTANSKPVEKKKEEPKKEEPKQLDIQKNIVEFEEENKSWKQFLKDFKEGKTKFGTKIKPEDYEKNKIKLKKLLEKTEMLGNKLIKPDIRNESDFYKGLVKNFISERNKITRLYNKAKTRFNNLSYLLDYGGVETEKKEEPKKEEPKKKGMAKEEVLKELDDYAKRSGRYIPKGEMENLKIWLGKEDVDYIEWKGGDKKTFRGRTIKVWNYKKPTAKYHIPKLVDMPLDNRKKKEEPKNN